ncbi:hydroxypyruvate isomerase [Marinobacter xestospongiae]|uniref:hydroxypyruvate isomerase n=1 Tax=Marinobacter xestospongiae TaxID=994319 RepID=UPI002005B542|nr:hydroxypyruvate isomerase [Marinobacter xestospongiae]MCK7568691.1 hydroxypyruvate isomerase [Marinobacter xestospongiae]
MPRFAANLTLLFNEVPFPERFAAARQAGFEGVEFLFPYPWRRQQLRQWLHDQGLTQVLFNLPPGDWDAGERGIACLPGRVDEFRRGVEQAIGYAQALGCERVNCLAGLAPVGVAEAEVWDTLVRNVDWANQQLAREGITLCVEAINSRVDMPGFVLDTSARALRLIAEVASDNLKLQYDLYHMQIMEGDLIRTLERCLPQVGHIQFADNPGRHQPGTGEIHFPAIFRALDRMGYTGWVSAEYRPSGRTEESLAWLARARN